MQQLLTGYEKVRGQLRAGFKLESVWVVLGVYKNRNRITLLTLDVSSSSSDGAEIGSKEERTFLERCRSQVLIG